MTREKAVPQLPPIVYMPVVEAGLREDLGRAGDLTSDALLAAEHRSRALVVARGAGRICGLDMVRETFRALEPGADWHPEHQDGADVAAGATLAVVVGRTRGLLAAERTALNLLGRMSGIATATRDLVVRVAGTQARITCTRKTTPGLRALEKYAVRVGGGRNHRFALDDAVLIKDNHLAAVGSIAEAVARARAAVGHTVKIEVEVDDLDQLAEALDAGVELVLLDNMDPDMLRRAVERCRGRAATEASGGITADTVTRVAATGVDVISVGWLTHSAPALDVALDMSSTIDGSIDEVS